MHLRQPPKRLLYALGGALIFGFLLFQFHTPDGPQLGPRPWGSSTPPTGLMGDIHNRTLGVSCIPLLFWSLYLS
jgi:hypothetical protein